MLGSCRMLIVEIVFCLGLPSDCLRGCLYTPPEGVRKFACCMGNPLLQVPPFQGGTDFSQLVPPACRENRFFSVGSLCLQGEPKGGGSCTYLATGVGARLRGRPAFYGGCILPKRSSEHPQRRRGCSKIRLLYGEPPPAGSPFSRGNRFFSVGSPCLQGEPIFLSWFLLLAGGT